MTPVTPYIIMTAAAPTKSSWKWQHRRRRIAVVECADPARPPKQIHPRHKAVKQIVQTWECLYVGSSDRDQFSCAMREAQALCVQLNDSVLRAAKRAVEMA